MKLKVPVTIQPDGYCKVFASTELAAKMHCLTNSRQGHYLAYWYDLPLIRRYCSPVVSDDSMDNLLQLKQGRKEAFAAKDIIAPDVSQLFTPQKQPRDFQLKGINFCLHQRNALLSDEVGLGKSIIGIGLFLKAFEQEIVDGLIVLCPNSLKHQMVNEMLDCNAYLPDLEQQITIVEGDKRKRYKAYEQRNTITLLNYQVLYRDEKVIRSLMEDRNVMVLADECTGNGGIKTDTSKTAKAFKRLFYDATIKLAMTATPIENGLLDLYSVMEWLHPGPMGGRSWFMGRFCRTIDITVERYSPKKRRKYKITIPKIIGYQNLKEAEARIREFYIRRTAQEVKEEMPQVVNTTYMVDLVPEARKLYDDLASGLRGQSQLFTKIVPLRRCCAAPCMVGGKGEDSGKIEELKRLLGTELAGESVIISVAWRRLWINILRKNLSAWKPLIITSETEDVARESIRQRFMDGESKLLIMTPVGQYGLNLQNASVLVNMSLPWNPAKLYQRCGRIVRIGSPHDRVRIVTILARDTIEERMVNVLSEKQDLFEAIFSTEGLMEATKVMKSMGDSAIRKLI